MLWSLPGFPFLHLAIAGGPVRAPVYDRQDCNWSGMETNRRAFSRLREAFRDHTVKKMKTFPLLKKKSFYYNIPYSPPRSPPLLPAQNTSLPVTSYCQERQGHKTDRVNLWENFVLRGPSGCSLGPLGILAGTSTNHGSSPRTVDQIDGGSPSILTPRLWLCSSLRLSINR